MQQDFDDIHERFLSRVRESGQVWGLHSGTGWAVCESGEYEDTLVYPFWSEAAPCALHCTGEWAGFKPTPVPLDEFIERWLPGMAEDNVLVGTDWDDELSGPEWEPLDLAEELLGDADEDEDLQRD